MTLTMNHPAAECLRSFFAEMNAWEVEAYRQEDSFDSESADEDAYERATAAIRKKLEAVFEKYCEEGARANRLQDAGVDFGDPPDYDPEEEIVISVREEEPGKVTIETKQTHGLRLTTRYEVVETNGMWRVKDNPKSSSETSPRWKPRRL